MAFRPRGIVCHVSASRWGDADAIRGWHRARGFADIGYHAVILNGCRTAARRYRRALDGKIEPGRPETAPGAHCRAGGMNRRALGVCLVGMPGLDGYPTPRQMAALVHILVTWCRRYGIPADQVTQHSDHEPGKPACASLRMEEIRQQVVAGLAAAGPPCDDRRAPA